LLSSLVFLGVFLLGCAKVGPPTGGPVDKDPPEIASHYPPADALQVALDTEVEIIFSEAMDRRRTEEALFVSPAGPMRLGWTGQRLRVALPLAEGRTYVLTVGTGARDLRGNSLEQSFTLAFATGDKLDKGVFRGRVYRAHQPEARAHVWAYDLGTFAGRVGLDEPSYQTQSGTDGAYEFARLAPGRYRVLAFVDEDRNALPDPGEWLALPAGDVEVGEEAAVAGDLALAAPEVPELVRVQAVHARRWLLIFGEAVDVAALALAIGGLAVEAIYAAPDEPQKVYVETELQEQGREYSVEQLALAGESIGWDEPVRGSSRTDRKGPSFVGRRPAGARLAPGDSLHLLFSEAMRPAGLDSFWIASDSTQAPVGTWQWPALNRALFVSAEPLTPGPYRLQGRPALLADRAGNALEDSLLLLSFEVVEETAAIRGRIEASAQGRVRIEALGEDGRIYGRWFDGGGDFALDDLLPGTYALWAFVDRDGDGARGVGTLHPFAPAEAYGRYGELVKLASGQRVEQLEIRCR
jgi:hypothetical protein